MWSQPPPPTRTLSDRSGVQASVPNSSASRPPRAHGLAA